MIPRRLWRRKRVEITRDMVSPYFDKIEKSKDKDQEKKALEEFAKWLKEHELAVTIKPGNRVGEFGQFNDMVKEILQCLGQEDFLEKKAEILRKTAVAVKERNYIRPDFNYGGPIDIVLACPCFPPVTPWRQFKIKDGSNLSALKDVLFREAMEQYWDHKELADIIQYLSSHFDHRVGEIRRAQAQIKANEKQEKISPELQSFLKLYEKAAGAQ